MLLWLCERADELYKQMEANKELHWNNTIYNATNASMVWNLMWNISTRKEHRISKAHLMSI